jgi:oxaloacetate decarboxylase alpha subunit
VTEADTAPAESRGLIDTTLRDGNQSLWATRMTTEMMLPILPVMDRAGFRAIEHISAVQMDACVRYLGENPWDRMRAVRQAVRHTPLRMLGISQYFSISRVLPDDVVELFIDVTSRYIDERWITASMNDVRTAEVAIRAAKRSGRRIDGGVQFTISPVHTDEYFVQVARDLAALGVDGIVLKDAGGLLTPERARTLVPALRAATGLEVLCHSHCVTGMGPAANLEALQAGAAATWTATPALANGASLPSDRLISRSLKWLGIDAGVDEQALTTMAEHFRGLAEDYGMPVGRPAEYDPMYYGHQMPGGMVSNFRAQLAELGMAHRFDEVLEEMPRVRAELGYPNVQTPYAQFIATQSLLNVIHGRYEVVPDEIRRLALGYWGRTPGPVDPDVLDRVGQGEEPVTGRPGDHVAPLVEQVRREQGPFDSDEDLLLAILFMPETLAKMQQTSGRPARVRRGISVVEVVRAAAAARDITSLSIVAPGRPTKESL